MKKTFGGIACLVISGTCALGCHGFDPTDPFSTAPLDHAIAKVGHSDCETSREAIQKQVKDVRGKGTSKTPVTSAWLCTPEGRSGVEVLHVDDSGRTADGSLEAWDDMGAEQRHDLPSATQQFVGGHDGNSFVFYSEDQQVDFSGLLTPNGSGLSGKIVVRNGTNCVASNYSCTRP